MLVKLNPQEDGALYTRYFGLSTGIYVFIQNRTKTESSALTLAICTSKIRGSLNNRYRLKAMKRTFQPSRIKRARTHGFRARSRTLGGRKVLKARRAKGRHRLAL